VQTKRCRPSSPPSVVRCKPDAKITEPNAVPNAHKEEAVDPKEVDVAEADNADAL
tara:strand:- start:1340 stop:1504 length:165 start_codon:yes stop_codon:yes gene_type:complete